MERLTKKNDSGGHYYPKCFEKCNGLGRVASAITVKLQQVLVRS